ncbi:hypothetical protein COLO4_16832 [Corchorus olitorius]|uniref:Uncharacterized protein n=1 Tax=Corchorus olitorius TaxID=93759 RepID=A0A1R3JFG3_9ROSI|nr:hypothetical protein COLO4_16832 [Corchorus olitorius]
MGYTISSRRSMPSLLLPIHNRRRYSISFTPSTALPPAT